MNEIRRKISECDVNDKRMNDVETMKSKIAEIKNVMNSEMKKITNTKNFEICFENVFEFEIDDENWRRFYWILFLFSKNANEMIENVFTIIVNIVNVKFFQNWCIIYWMYVDRFSMRIFS